MTRSKPLACSDCPLCAHGTDFSAIEGTGSSGVLLVGEASGEHEQRDGLPFRPYAPAGSLLERTFRRMGIDRKMFAITNAIRCRPRNNWLEGSPWEYSALAHCRPNLDAAIAGYHPRAIVALGGTALRELTGEAGEARGISHLAGYVLPLARQTRKVQKMVPEVPWPVDGVVAEASAIPVIGDFHPAFLRRGKASHQGVFARIIQRAVNIAAGKDRDWLWNVVPEDRSTHGHLRYQVHPSLDEAGAFAARVQSNGDLPVSYDLETFESASLDEDAREGFTDTQIRLIQFSLADGSGIALPWEGAYREIARRVLHSGNVKCGHNIWLFDNKVLRAASEREGVDYNPRGTLHDTLQMYHHWQPDLPAHLQFAASFVNFPFPWKHLAGTDIEFYGCADVDATLRLYTFLKAKLIADGIWDDASYIIKVSEQPVHVLGPKHAFTIDGEMLTANIPEMPDRPLRGYIGQVACVRPVLAAMEDRGVPIDDAARVALGAEFEIAQRELGVEIAGRAPVACQRVHPKEGYAGNPPEVREWFSEKGVKLSTKSEMAMLGGDAELVKTLASVRFQDSPTKNADGTITEDGEWYTYQRRSFRLSAALVDAYGEPTIATEATERWCRVYDFNPNSSQQLIAYMKSKGHKVPKSKEEDAEGNAKDTTAAKELQRLAARTSDDFYLKVIEYRGLTKMRGTYVDGFKPGPDGRVHTTFTFDTSIGQLSSRNPNCFSADTETLTMRGWVPFPALTAQDQVAQYLAGVDITGRLGIITFVKPDQIIQLDSPGSLLHIETEQQVDLLLTSDHRCLVRDRKTLGFRYKDAKDYPQDMHQMQAGWYVGGDLHYSQEQIALICALQADGHVMKSGSHYTFGFTKERKIARLRACLAEMGISFTENVRKTGIKQTTFYISRKDIPEWWLGKKFFGSWILELTRESMDYISEEIWFWDGCYDRRGLYSSSIKSNVDWAQIITILSNRRAKIREYMPPSGNINWQLDAASYNCSSTANHISTEVPYKGSVYCVTMPQGTVIVRRKGKVAITGNCQNFPKLKPTPALAKAMRAMICADPGHIITEIDFKSCHVITLGHLAGDANYTRLGRLDIHSFVAGHFLNLWDGEHLFKEPDDVLLAKFKWLKSDPERKRVRDDQAKHGILGIGNGLRAKGLYERYMESFPARACPECGGTTKVPGLRGLKKCPACRGTGRQSGLAIAEQVLAACERLFPRVFEYQETQRKEAHERQVLRTPFGHQRRFYEVYRWDYRKSAWGHGDQAEQAVAYRLANTAHAHMREVMKELDASGMMEKYACFNQVHDSLMFHHREETREEIVRDVFPVMMADSVVMPGLYLGVEGSQGRRWSEMRDCLVPALAGVSA